MLKILYRVLGAIVLLAIVIFLVFRNPDKSVDELSALYTDEASEWVMIDKMNVHFKKEGNGPAIVLLHGTGASLHTWDGWTEILSESMTVYRMDLPAFGLTGPHPDRDYSIDMYLSFIHQFVKSQNIENFALAGNSLGGFLAWAYTVKYPDKVGRLILLDSAGYPSEEESNALAFQIASHPILSPLMKHITPRSFLRKNLEQVYADKSKVSEELVVRYHDMALRKGNRQAFIDRVHVHHKDRSNSIQEIKCPTLILWGGKDTWVDPADAYKFKEEIANSELIVYPNVGHVPMEEIPKRSGQDALRFLTSESIN